MPAIPVPCGFTKSGLPIGLQIAGPHWQEDLEIWCCGWLRPLSRQPTRTGKVPNLMSRNSKFAE